jgi:hypothetical protein
MVSGFFYDLLFVRNTNYKRVKNVPRSLLLMVVVVVAVQCPMKTVKPFGVRM